MDPSFGESRIDNRSLLISIYKAYYVAMNEWMNEWTNERMNDCVYNM